MTDVSVLGLGLMGSAVAKTLLNEHTVTVWNRTPEKASPLIESGAEHADSALAAVRASPATISVLVDADALKQSLGEDVDLTGRTIINLATGTPEDAEDLAAWVRARSGSFLSGTISAYPKDIGQTGGGVNFSGPQELWERYETMLLLLGGFTCYLGPQVTDACTLDMAMLMFYMSGLASFQEAIAYSEAHGINPQRLFDYVQPTIPILERELEESSKRVIAEDYFTDEATIDTFHHCMDLATRSLLHLGMSSYLPRACRELFARGVSEGRKDEIPAGMVPLLRAPK